MADYPSFDHPSSYVTNFEHMADEGLNLAAVFEVNQLPSQIIGPIQEAGIKTEAFQRLVLFGNGGKLFWERLDHFGVNRPDPIDSFSLHLTRQFMQRIAGKDDHQLILYPQNELFLPLQQLGQMAGWGTPSPIGNSINPMYGLWFAFRSAFLTSVPLPVMQVDLAPSPCLSCETKPCQVACPAGAVKASADRFKLDHCITHRLKENSPCAFDCLARQACPVGAEHRYPSEAVHLLYGSSINAIRRCKADRLHPD